MDGGRARSTRPEGRSLMGRDKKSPSNLKATGNPGKKDIDAREKTEVRAVKGEPRIPEGMSSEGMEEWRRIIPILSELGVLTHADGLIIGLLCEAISDLKDHRQYLSDNVRKDGWAAANYERRGLGHVAHPVLAEIRKLETSIISFGMQLGLSPKARGQIETAPPTDNPRPKKPRPPRAIEGTR